MQEQCSSEHPIYTRNKCHIMKVAGYRIVQVGRDRLTQRRYTTHLQIDSHHMRSMITLPICTLIRTTRASN